MKKILEFLRGLDFDISPQLRRKISIGVVAVAMLLGYLLSLSPPPDALAPAPSASNAGPAAP